MWKRKITVEVSLGTLTSTLKISFRQQTKAIDNAQILILFRKLWWKENL